MGIETAALMGLASSGMSALGSIQEGKQAKKWAKYQKKQAQADAINTIHAGQVEAKQIRNNADRGRKTAVADIASSGVVVGQDTAQDVEKRFNEVGEYDAQMTMFNANDAANRILAEGQAAYIQGKQAERAGYMKAFGSLLGGIGGVAGGWSTGGASAGGGGLGAFTGAAGMSNGIGSSAINKVGRSFGSSFSSGLKIR